MRRLEGCAFVSCLVGLPLIVCGCARSPGLQLGILCPSTYRPYSDESWAGPLPTEVEQVVQEETPVLVTWTRALGQPVKLESTTIHATWTATGAPEIREYTGSACAGPELTIDGTVALEVDAGAVTGTARATLFTSEDGRISILSDDELSDPLELTGAWLDDGTAYVIDAEGVAPSSWRFTVRNEWSTAAVSIYALGETFSNSVWLGSWTAE